MISDDEDSDREDGGERNKETLAEDLFEGGDEEEEGEEIPRQRDTRQFEELDVDEEEEDGRTLKLTCHVIYILLKKVLHHSLL